MNRDARHWAAWLAGTCTIAAVAVLYRLGASPLFVYDEARLAINALEMSYDGFSLVTTYDGAPDHWNTKPPLLIWAMAVSIRLFGASEWSVRLPSALAAIATCVLLFWFCFDRSRRPLVGFLAPLLLLASPVFLGWHGARSGNYDAPLALFTTAYLCAAYLCLARPGRPVVGWLVACAAGIVL
ncbi:MAG TPA: glycosyltransferase family 39 protein, partial [Steroidobacteraceae bacterium]|nr:glycosyltransferase family 39 protein [Steroidobacteraceae bacterium]